MEIALHYPDIISSLDWMTRSLAVKVVTVNPNAYLIALIAVLGTVVGAAISAITQFFTARGSSANQLTALQLSLKHATHEGLLQERRRTYTKFLLTMERWNLLCGDVYEAAQKGRSTPDVDVALEEYRAVHTELNLLAGRELADLAERQFNQDRDMMSSARDGIKPERNQSNAVSATALTAVMQEELNAILDISIDHTWREPPRKGGRRFRRWSRF